MADSLAMEQDALEKLQTIKPRRLSGEDLVTYEAFKYGREINAEGYRFPSELLPIHQFSNLASFFAVAGSGQGIQPFRTAQDYDNFLSRMDGFAAWADQSIANMKIGVAKGVVQPRIVVERTIPQLAAQIVDDPKQSVFWQPILNFPAGLSVADRQRLMKAYDEKIATVVMPAYRRLHDYLEDRVPAEGPCQHRPVGAVERRVVVRVPGALSHEHLDDAGAGARARSCRGRADPGGNGAGQEAGRPCGRLAESFRRASRRPGPPLQGTGRTARGIRGIAAAGDIGVAAALCGQAKGDVRDPGRRGVSRVERCSRFVHAWECRWETAGRVLRQHARPGVAPEVFDGGALPARGRTRASSAERDRAGGDGPASVQAVRVRHGLWRGLGTVCGVARSRPRPVHRPLQRVRRTLGRDVAGRAAGGGHRHSLEGLDARAGYRLFPREYCGRRNRHRGGGGSLHCDARTGAGLQGRAAGDTAAAPARAAEARAALRHPCVSSQMLESGSLPLPVLEAKIDRWIGK